MPIPRKFCLTGADFWIEPHEGLSAFALMSLQEVSDRPKKAGVYLAFDRFVIPEDSF